MRDGGTTKLWHRRSVRASRQSGKLSWYGKWRHNGTQVKRRIGAKRTEGSREGLTRTQAEAELRRLIGEVKPIPAAHGEVLTIAELGRRYLLDLERRAARRTTRAAVETALRSHLEPFFGERAIQRVSKRYPEGLKAGRAGSRVGAQGQEAVAQVDLQLRDHLAVLYRFAIRETGRAPTRAMA
jgi:hypothetical protein